MQDNTLLEDLSITVQRALEEDIGSGDITAELIPADNYAQAQVICKDEFAVIAGEPWVNEVFRQIDPSITVEWHLKDGANARLKDLVFTAKGPARALLSAERSALNFLQTLSSVATSARQIADLTQHTKVKILDTRKTLPGLRRAQKYAVLQGGCHNHRIGLYDAFLIKENHINACGGTQEAIESAKALYPDRPVEVEVESLSQLEEALNAKADIVMLDNFDLETIRKAVEQNNGRAKLEASGGYSNESVVAVAETGVDYISLGSLTKNCKAVDFSMLFI